MAGKSTSNGYRWQPRIEDIGYMLTIDEKPVIVMATKELCRYHKYLNYPNCKDYKIFECSIQISKKR